MTETAPQYFQNRIEGILKNVRDPDWRRRTYTFYRRTDPETERRAHLPLLNPNLDWVRIDEEGDIYISSWRQTKGIDEEPRIFGPTQVGRDYHLNPPKTKTLEKLGFDHVAGGIDVALRRAIEIRNNYRLEEGEPTSEAGQMIGTLGRLSELRRELQSFPDLSDNDLAEIIEDNLRFLADYGYVEPKLKEKIRIMGNLSRGFTDRTGRKNALAAHTRMFAIELAIRKRLEVAFPAILAKYATIVELLSFERESIRMVIAASVEDLEDILTRESFTQADQGRVEKPPIKEIYEVVWPMDGVSSALARGVRAKPYIAVATDVVVDLGATNFAPRTRLGQLRTERRREGVPTAMEYFMAGRFSEARGIVERDITRLRETVAALV